MAPGCGVAVAELLDVPRCRNSLQALRRLAGAVQDGLFESHRQVAPVRPKRFGLTPAQRLEWIVEPDGIRVVPVAEDPIEAFRGRGKGGAAARLVADRQADRDRA